MLQLIALLLAATGPAFGQIHTGGGGSSSGNISGPASSTDNALAIYDGLTGKILKNSVVNLSTAGLLALPSGGGVTISLPTTLASGTSPIVFGPGKASYHSDLQSGWDDSTYILGQINQTNKVTTLRVFNQSSTPAAYTLGISARVECNPASGTTPVCVSFEGDTWANPTGAGTIIDFNVGSFSQANPNATAGAVITNNIGHLIYTPVLGGGSTAPTLGVGLYIQPQTAGASNYGVYQAGTAELNYFGGATVFGSGFSSPASTSASASFRVTPGVDQSSGLAEGNIWWNDSSGVLKAYNGSGVKTFAFTDSSMTGNAATATALAANPTDCTLPAYATAIAANGNLTCTTPPAHMVMSLEGYTPYTNIAAAETEFPPAAPGIYRTAYDFTNVTQVRLTCLVVAGAAGGSALMKAQYSTNSGGAWADLGAQCSLTSATLVDSGWQTIAAGAKNTNVWVRLASSGGNGADDPAVGLMEVFAR